MPYRDPETGQFVSDDDDGRRGLCYNDHITVTWTVEAEQTAGNNATRGQGFVIDLPQLDNDELAQLTYMTTALVVRNDPDAGTANTSPGSINAVAEIGANLDGEYLTGEQGTDNVSEGITSSDTSFITDTTGADDDHGHFAILSAAADAGYQDSGTSTGGAGGVSVDRYERDFRSIYGEGPWLDATDDLEGKMRINKNTTASDARAHLVGQAVFHVVEDDHCRPSFGLRT